MLMTDIIYAPATPADPASAQGGKTWAEEALALFSRVLVSQFGASGTVRVLCTSHGPYTPGICAGTLAVSDTGDDSDDAIINIAVYDKYDPGSEEITVNRVLRMLTPVVF
jgi:hypothetical protein